MFTLNNGLYTVLLSSSKTTLVEQGSYNEVVDAWDECPLMPIAVETSLLREYMGNPDGDTVLEDYAASATAGEVEKLARMAIKADRFAFVMVPTKDLDDAILYPAHLTKPAMDALVEYTKVEGKWFPRMNFRKFVRNVEKDYGQTLPDGGAIVADGSFYYMLETSARAARNALALIQDFPPLVVERTDKYSTFPFRVGMAKEVDKA